MTKCFFNAILMLLIMPTLFGCGVFTQAALIPMAAIPTPETSCAIPSTKDCKSTPLTELDYSFGQIASNSKRLCFTLQAMQKGDYLIHGWIKGAVDLPGQSHDKAVQAGECPASLDNLEQIDLVTSHTWQTALDGFSKEFANRFLRAKSAKGTPCVSIHGATQDFDGCLSQASQSVTWRIHRPGKPIYPLVAEEEVRVLVKNTMLPLLNCPSLQTGSKIALIRFCGSLEEARRRSCFAIISADKLQFYPISLGIPNTIDVCKITPGRNCSPSTARTAVVLVAAPLLISGFVLDAVTFPIQSELGTMCGDNGCGKNARH